MTAQPFTGYAGVVWQQVYRALNYYLLKVEAADIQSDPAAVFDLSSAMLNTVLNGLDAITASVYANMWQVEAINMQTIGALPLVVAPSDSTFFQNRQEAYTNAWPALTAIVPLPPFIIPESSLSMGDPAIPDPGLLEFYEGFSYETPPVGLSGATFASQAAACAQAMENVANAIFVFQGAFPTQLYDVATRQADCAETVSTMIASLESGAVNQDVLTTNSWNQIVALPALTMDAAMQNGAPYTQDSQQVTVIRYAMLDVTRQITLFLLNLQRPISATVNITTLLINESLMDVAARTLGDYSRWREIAALNNLLPPFVGAVGTPSIAAWGQQLVIPSPGTEQAETGASPSYTQNFLGTDLYIGPVNGDMPTWTGDFQTITGYNNLSWALSRRLQTLIGTLIYQPSYGSRIPGEIGNVQDSQTINQISAYGRSALLSDRRVQAVLYETSRKSDGTINFDAKIKPIGQGSSLVGVNQVIVPL